MAAYRPRGVHKIFGFVKKHQPGKIDESRRPKSRRRTAAKVDSDVATIVGHARH